MDSQLRIDQHNFKLMAAGKKFKHDRPLLLRIKELEGALQQAYMIIKAQEAVIKELRPTTVTEPVI